MISLKSFILSKKFDNVPYDFNPKTRDELVNTIIQLTREHYSDPIIDLNCIDTSQITDMNNLFNGLHEFKYDISKWDVSNVKNMTNMFNGCIKFNCDLSKWNVRKVEKMFGMFNGCTQFNSDISDWNVSHVKSMKSIFWDCMNFNCDLSNWDVRNVKDVKQTTDIFRFCDMSKHPELQPKFE